MSFDRITTLHLKSLRAEMEFYLSISELADAMGNEAAAKKHAENAAQCKRKQELISGAAILRDMPSLETPSKGKRK